MEINWFLDLVGTKINEYTKLKKYQEDEEEAWRQAEIDTLTDLMETEFDVDDRDEDGETILMYLAGAGDLSLVKWLVEKKGADVNALTYDETEFALYDAANKGWQEIFDYLAPLTNPKLRVIAEQALPQGLLYRQRKQNKSVENFIEASRSGNLKQVIATINNGIEIDAIGSNGATALHEACSFKQLSVVEVLLKAGANPNIPDEIGACTPLMLVLENTVYSKKNNLTISKLLLEAGVDVNIKDKQGNTLLSRIKQNKNEDNEIVQFFINAGATED